MSVPRAASRHAPLTAAGLVPAEAGAASAQVPPAAAESDEALPLGGDRSVGDRGGARRHDRPRAAHQRDEAAPRARRARPGNPEPPARLAGR